MSPTPSTPDRSRVRATWSSLQCLSSELSPPSPALSLPFGSSPTSTGEIPIVLHSGISPLSVPLSPTPTRPRVRARTRTTSNSTLTSISSFIPEPYLPGSHSNTSVDTFGCKRPALCKMQDAYSPQTTASSSIGAMSTSSLNTSSSPHSSDESFCSMSSDEEDTISLRLDVPFSISNTTFSSYHTAQNDSTSTGPSDAADTFLLSLDALDEQELSDEIGHQSPWDSASFTSSDESLTASTLTHSSLRFAPFTSPSFADLVFPPPPSRTSLVRRNGVHSRAMKTKRTVPSYVATNPQFDDDISEPFARLLFLRNHSPAPSIVSTSPSMKSVRTIGSIGSSKSNSEVSIESSHIQSPELAQLSSSFEWLRAVEIESMIDQEGFRSIRPSFKFSNYSPTTDGHGLAEFKPTHRTAFKFHHSPLDSDPVLRRLMRDGDENHDFISRYATLTLKSPGIYAVSGNEQVRGRALTGPPSPTRTHGENSPATSGESSFLSLCDDSDGAHRSSTRKLRWTFEYSVDHHRSIKTGEIVPGEMILVPRSFRCSPLLLHTDVGAKVGLMQLAKKAARFNLVAHKVAGATLKSVSPSLIPVVRDRRSPLRSRANQRSDVDVAEHTPWAGLGLWSKECEYAGTTSIEEGLTEDEKPLLKGGTRHSPHHSRTELGGDNRSRPRPSPTSSLSSLKKFKGGIPSPRRAQNTLLGRPIANKADLSKAVSGSPSDTDSFAFRIYSPIEPVFR